MKILELRGLKSLRAFNVFHKLMLGIKMVPAYMGEDYASFYERVEKMDLDDRRKVFREAATFVDLEPDEVMALVCFCADANGVPYGPANVGNLDPAAIVELIVEVCLKISEIKVTLISETEKKNSQT